MNYRILFAGLFATCAFSVSAQTSIEEPASKKDVANTETRALYPRKGKLSVCWGYNRSAYTHSDIHFWGSDYNFTARDLRATDNPTKFSKDYFGPSTVTIPEYAWRVTYFITDKTFVCAGEDHMKYKMATQATQLTGNIGSGPNKGTYNNTNVLVGEGLDATNMPAYLDGLPKGIVSSFQHCDGLNDFSLQLGRLEQLWISQNRRQALSVLGSASAGAMITDSEVEMLGQESRHDKGEKLFHLSGYSMSASMGLQFDFFNRAFLLASTKSGYINLPDINTTAGGGRASQHFDYIEAMVTIGYTFQVRKAPKN